MAHDTQSTQHARSKEHNTYIVTSWRHGVHVVYVVHGFHIVVMRRMGALDSLHDVTIYVLCSSLLCVCWSLYVPWTNFCFNQYIYGPSLVLAEHSVGSNTNNAWTPLLAVHSRHVATKLLRWWGGWAHWIVFMYCNRV